VIEGSRLDLSNDAITFAETFILFLFFLWNVVVSSTSTSTSILCFAQQTKTAKAG